MVRVLKNIYINAGFEDASSHSGRRSLLTKLADEGVSAFHIQEIAGHASVLTTQRYIDHNPIVIANILKNV
ncbi:MAG: integrase [Methylophaga sp.]|nr:MAG: integrase [Methylophaga sp.]